MNAAAANPDSDAPSNRPPSRDPRPSPRVKREIVINVSPLDVRLALLEDNSLTEFYLERSEHRGLAGNIYKGRVTRVLPGMQAAFVDIGLDKAGFLHVSDFRDDIDAAGAVVEDIDEEIGEVEVQSEPIDDPGHDVLLAENGARTGAEGEPPRPGGGRRRRRRRGGRGGGGGGGDSAGGGAGKSRRGLPIEQQLRRGQEIIVQIAKEPIGGKGARLTSHVSIPGRHLVYTPTGNRIGISRRIESAEERARLRAALIELRPAQGGFIVRTACEGVSRKEIQQDITFLTKLWKSIVKKSEKSGPASLLYSDLDLPLRAVRDFFSSEIERLWCDDSATCDRIAEFVQNYMPRLRSRLSMHDSDEPIFERFKIEPQIMRALERKVWLESGGYLVFDQAEALTAIDVNTGRFVGKRSQDETVLKTNLEAVEEVVRQLRLRNIGGIIIVDFIDMAREPDRKRVSEALTLALKRDKARTSTLKISELGLVQMTRKRIRESLEQMLTEPCHACAGIGVVKSVATVAAEVLRGVRREARRQRASDMIVVRLSPEVARYLYGAGAAALEAFEKRIGVKIVLRSKDGLEPGAFELSQAPAAA